MGCQVNQRKQKILKTKTNLKGEEKTTLRLPGVLKSEYSPIENKNGTRSIRILGRDCDAAECQYYIKEKGKRQKAVHALFITVN